MVCRQATAQYDLPLTNAKTRFVISRPPEIRKSRRNDKISRLGVHGPLGEIFPNIKTIVAAIV